MDVPAFASPSPCNICFLSLGRACNSITIYSVVLVIDPQVFSYAICIKAWATLAFASPSSKMIGWQEAAERDRNGGIGKR